MPSAYSVTNSIFFCVPCASSSLVITSAVAYTAVSRRAAHVSPQPAAAPAPPPAKPNTHLPDAQ